MTRKSQKRTARRKVREQESTVETSGILEVLPDGYGFLRSIDSSLSSRSDDVYVPRSVVRSFGLMTGCCLLGEAANAGNKLRLTKLHRVSGQTPEDFRSRATFDSLTPQQPNRRLDLGSNELSMRIVDLFTPIGKGQRGLIVSPPRAGKTVLIQQLAESILSHHKECQVIILLIDERPEEVTEIEDLVENEACEVFSSTFDQRPNNHVRLAKLVLERAKRLVELGEDVVILLDSITRLTRAHNALSPASSKTTAGGLVMEALVGPKEFFGSARQLRDSGSLTILASALVDTGTRMDYVIFEEFKGTGNMEIHLSRDLVDRQVWPAIDIRASGTRRTELLVDAEENRRLMLLRKALSRLDPVQAMELVTDRVKKTDSNAEFLLSIASVDQLHN